MGALPHNYTNHLPIFSIRHHDLKYLQFTSKPATFRSALKAQTRKETFDIQHSMNGFGPDSFIWGQFPKIIDIDQQLKKRRELRKIVYEIHSELSFQSMNGGSNKLSRGNPAGAAIRKRLITGWFGADVLNSVRKRYYKNDCLDQEIYDSFLRN